MDSRTFAAALMLATLAIFSVVDAAPCSDNSNVLAYYDARLGVRGRVWQDQAGNYPATINGALHVDQSKMAFNLWGTSSTATGATVDSNVPVGALGQAWTISMRTRFTDCPSQNCFLVGGSKGPYPTYPMLGKSAGQLCISDGDTRYFPSSLAKSVFNNDDYHTVTVVRESRSSNLASTRPTAIYVDGQLVDSSVYSSSTGLNTLENPESTLIIGAATGAGGNAWSGFIDSILVQNHEASLSEVQAIHTKFSTGELFCEGVAEIEKQVLDLNVDLAAGFANLTALVEGQFNATFMCQSSAVTSNNMHRWCKLRAQT